jgi:hypothetical protein
MLYDEDLLKGMRYYTADSDATNLMKYYFLIHNVYSEELPITALQLACMLKLRKFVVLIMSYFAGAGKGFTKMYVNYDAVLTMPFSSSSDTVKKCYRAIELIDFANNHAIDSDTQKYLKEKLYPKGWKIGVTKVSEFVASVFNPVKFVRGARDLYALGRDIEVEKIKKLLIDYNSEDARKHRYYKTDIKNIDPAYQVNEWKLGNTNKIFKNQSGIDYIQGRIKDITGVTKGGSINPERLPMLRYMARRNRRTRRMRKNNRRKTEKS